VKLYEQGKSEGLPNKVIRADIGEALQGIIQERRLRQILPLKRAYNITSVNSANQCRISLRSSFSFWSCVSATKWVKLIHGDFREECTKLADNCVDLIFTDPPYDNDSIPLYKDLAEVAFRVLKAGGSLVTYCGGDLENMYQIIGFMKSKGLTPWWSIPVLHEGPFAKVFPKQVTVTWKPLLWFVKGDKLRTPDFIRDSIQSKHPDKTNDQWKQSPLEAEHVISRLTIENDAR
jgi:hypothetical protein